MSRVAMDGERSRVSSLGSTVRVGVFRVLAGAAVCSVFTLTMSPGCTSGESRSEPLRRSDMQEFVWIRADHWSQAWDSPVAQAPLANVSVHGGPNYLPTLDKMGVG